MSVAIGDSAVLGLAMRRTMRQLRSMGRSVVSLGTFCLNQAMIRHSGVRQPSYPFDDIFSNIDIVIDCLSDGFAKFSDRSKYIQLGNSHQWGHQHYLDTLDFHLIFNHHDMSAEANIEKFGRRVDRLLALSEADNPLFVISANGERLRSVFAISALRRELARRFGRSHLLAIVIGEGMPCAEAARLPNATIRRFVPTSASDGVRFSDKADNDRFASLISEAYYSSDRPADQGFSRLFA
jgi:hypothetical protein